MRILTLIQYPIQIIAPKECLTSRWVSVLLMFIFCVLKKNLHKHIRWFFFIHLNVYMDSTNIHQLIENYYIKKEIHILVLSIYSIQDFAVFPDLFLMQLHSNNCLFRSAHRARLHNSNWLIISVQWCFKKSFKIWSLKLADSIFAIPSKISDF